VKPIHLNLAARPYRDYRPVYAVVVLLSLLTAFLMLNNVETYYRYTHETRNTRAKIASIEAQTRQERERDAIAQRRLKTLDLARLDAQTKFVNARLAQRAFSWSALLDELESVLDDDVRLLSIAPTFSDDGTILLSLQFQAKQANGMIETINRMHADPQFHNPFPSNERVVEGIGYAFDLTAEYRPVGPNTATKSLADANMPGTTPSDPMTVVEVAQ
jgi:type IV pilus assembly protein PilN